MDTGDIDDSLDSLDDSLDALQEEIALAERDLKWGSILLVIGLSVILVLVVFLF